MIGESWILDIMTGHEASRPDLSYMHAMVPRNAGFWANAISANKHEQGNSQSHSIVALFGIPLQEDHHLVGGLL